MLYQLVKARAERLWLSSYSDWGYGTLINRFATTEEVANMVIYVCSEQASATSGAGLRVDGGVLSIV